MHQDRTHHFIGAPNENITITSSVPTSGALQLMFGGRSLGVLPQTVQFPATPGQSDLVATLVGPPGSQCVLSIANVDGRTDMSILLVASNRTHDTTLFEFVAAAPAVVAFMATSANVRL